MTNALTTAPASAGELMAGFPAPPTDGIQAGPIFIGFYGLCIVLGMGVALWISLRLWKSRGGSPDNIFDAFIWAVIFGFVGARLYHVLTSPDAYFGPGFDGTGELSRIFDLRSGGLGIWGAVALGALGVWLACKRYGMKFGALADAVVPGVLIAQAIGRWGNWFNEELYGRSTTLPWGLEVSMDNPNRPAGATEETLFHPTFLYESLWNLAGFVLLLWLFKRFQFKQGLLTWTYVAYYTLGRLWIENLRIDPAQHVELFGITARLNIWTSLAMFALAVAILLWLFSRRPRTAEELEEELEIYRPGRGPRAENDEAGADSEKDESKAESSSDDDAEEASDAEDAPEGEGDAEAEDDAEAEGDAGAEDNSDERESGDRDADNSDAEAEGSVKASAAADDSDSAPGAAPADGADDAGSGAGPDAEKSR